MDNKVILVLFLCLIPFLLWLMPWWLIWTVKEIFGIDWSDKFWAVLSLMFICGGIFKASGK